MNIKDMNFSEMSDRQIQKKYDDLLLEGRLTYQNILNKESFLDSGFWGACLIVLWMWEIFMVFFLIFIDAPTGLQMLIIGGIPLAVLLFARKQAHKQISENEAKHRSITRKLDQFRLKLRKENRDIPGIITWE
ncbi:hypothetical protein [Alkalihalobacterium elongatum]|uniref:hypothetical protein n=1 Tax=Alkalihalobacterium elongatum TaxID=2675466 RepID=UPI001C1F5184|nr:hypothetical protein [Alkalihalobacterium elongatum]